MTEFNGEIHPYAAIFPMLPDEDLNALADDITANGQLHPILLTPDGVLVDGRNRLAACDLAGVQPRFEVTAQDPVALVMSANLQRRDLTPTMKAYFTVAGGSNGTNREMAAIAGVSHGLIGKAQVVARFAPESFRSVLAGESTADAAYQVAKAEKDRLAELEDLRSQIAARHPDLLDGRPIEAAKAEYEQRLKKEEQEARERKEAIQRQVSWIKSFLIGYRMAAGMATSPTRGEVLDALDPFDRDRFLTIEKETQWPSTLI